jgi:hypothetical protein
MAVKKMQERRMLRRVFALPLSPSGVAERRKGLVPSAGGGAPVFSGGA